ncbi:protein tyrosine phosphatase [Triplophysa rosa]|uniref:Protein tyrosine phosphatase n=1 Tax=Triplophysa rosa TaxID=992332 RepID=A0A9W7WUK0_TRIRA|nr:protein tyrosine phosphatase [Triplophysa rosa]
MHPRVWRALFFMTVFYQLGMAGKYDSVSRKDRHDKFCYHTDVTHTAKSFTLQEVSHQTVHISQQTASLLRIQTHSYAHMLTYIYIYPHGNLPIKRVYTNPKGPFQIHFKGCVTDVCVCVIDRLFGQCRSSRHEQVQYQVSVPVLQRLQEVLKQLMIQGICYRSYMHDLASKVSYLFSSCNAHPQTSIIHNDSLILCTGYSSSNSEPGPAQSYMDYLILDPRQSSSLRMQALPMDPYSYLQVQLSDPPPETDLSNDKVTQKGVKPPSPVSALPSTPTYQRSPTQPPSTPAPATVPKEVSKSTLAPTLSPKDLGLKEKTANVLKAGKDGTNSREEYGYIVTNQSPLSLYDGVKLLELLAEKIHFSTSSFINISVVGPALTFRIRQNSLNLTAEDVANKAVAEKNFLEGETGLKIIQTGVGERSEGRGLPQATRVGEGSRRVVLTMVAMACVGTVLLVALAIACLRHHARQLASGKLGLGPEAGAETHFDYQELCRQHMAAKTSFTRPEPGGRRGTDTSRVSSVSSQFSDGPQHSPSSHSSTPSWSEEPAQSNMDISTGHMILAYMEDHLKNKDRLQKEWEALCLYQAEPSSVSIGQSESNMEKNRYPDFVPYDHSRVKLKAETNPSKEDYINASTIIDHDPRLPAYIATQGPLPHTIADFWQMVWENGCTVIVMMTALVEDGEKQCERYWPDEGSSLYNIYEVNLVSEHIWCKDFLVRSFYLKNVQTQETRTLTQFHLLSWPASGIPSSTRPLLDFRRKVNKCYRGRSCPIIVHCSDGTGRTGTYILIDMVLNRMAKGVKEIDIAATLEHIRDQRPSMVRTKDQFEFALTAVAEEVNAILKALPQ